MGRLAVGLQARLFAFLNSKSFIQFAAKAGIGQH
jgi:hypothetical protein